MIYLVTTNRELFENDVYKIIGVDESLSLLSPYSILQADSETDGRDAHINRLLSFQLGTKVGGFQVVIDCTTIDIRRYKDILESKYLIFHNGKFDLQFLYNYHIIPLKIYDTMIVEQLLYLGWSSKPGDINFRSVSLAAIAERRLGIFIDKSIRSQIIWRGLDVEVVKYAADDVVYLEDIMQSQIKECRDKQCIVGAKLECDFVPVIAYMEWCGIKLDVSKWKAKMQRDLECLEEARKALDNFVITNPNLQQFTYINYEGNLFTGFDLSPKCKVLWTSSDQVIKVAKALGFDTKIQDKKTGEDKDSVIEKQLKKQKGIRDEFLTLYFGKGEEGDDDYFMGHQGAAKLVSSFGQGHLNAINPKTGRIHTSYKQLGADTGRMSSGSKQNNDDLARYKGLPSNPTSKQKKEGKGCPYPNMQQLPSDAITRSCFVSEKGNLWASCDYSAIESRLGADIYQEKSMIDEFLHGSGDLHSLTAWMVFRKKCEALGCTSVADVKKKAPQWRSKAKPIEFSQQFGGSEFAIQNAMGCTMEEAIAFRDNYAKGFPGIAAYKIKGSKSVREKGYVTLCPITGHKTYWWDHNVWIKRQQSFTQAFWEDYRLNHKGTGDSVAEEVREHFQAASKWDRKALNSPTQGLGAVILKDSQIQMFHWVVSNGYFGKILLVNLTHDEANWEFPKEIDYFPKLLQGTMEKTAAKYCKSLPIPASVEVSDHWVH